MRVPRPAGRVNSGRLSQCLPPVEAGDARSTYFSSKPIGYAEHLHKVISVSIYFTKAFELILAKFASLIQCRSATAVAGDGVAIRYTLENDGVEEGDHAAPPVAAAAASRSAFLRSMSMLNALDMTASPM